MAKQNSELYLVGKSRRKLSARAWIDRISKAFEKRAIPMHLFVLVPGSERPGSEQGSKQG